MWFPSGSTQVYLTLGCEKVRNTGFKKLTFYFNHVEFRWRQKEKLTEHFQ